MGFSVGELYQYLGGAIMTGCLVIALHFFRFWTKSQDRLFAYFAVAFLIFASERVVILMYGNASSENHAGLYLVRLLGFVLIMFAIYDKNKRKT